MSAAAKSGVSGNPPAVSGAEASKRFPKLVPLIEYLETLTGRADLGTLERLLRAANVTLEDIRAACVFGERGYRRNTISRSEQYELLALCWRSGDCTPIHDHMGHSCAFRVVHGTGTEVRFRTTSSGQVCPVATNTMEPGYLCSADDPDIHQVVNLQGAGEDLVTLHIYSPPIRSMRTYGALRPREFEPLERDPGGHEGCL